MEVSRLEPRLDLGRIGIGSSLLGCRLLLLSRIHGQKAERHLGAPDRIPIVVD